MSKLLSNVEALKKAEILRAKIKRYEHGFRIKYPLLLDYINGEKPVEECAAGYFRDKINAHKRIIKELTKEAARLEEFGQRQQCLFS